MAVQAHRADAAVAAGETQLAISAVTQELRVTQRTVVYLVENGLMYGVDASELCRRGTTVVTAVSIARLRGAFISLDELADIARRPQGALSIKLRNVGVTLLAIPQDLSRIYWREDASAYAPAEQ